MNSIKQKSQMRRKDQFTRNSSRHNFESSHATSITKKMSSFENDDVIARSVKRSGLSYDSFVRLIVQSALGRLSIWTQADLERLLLIAERLGLDPLSSEIYALEKEIDKAKKPQIIFVVGVDGWTKIINSNSQFDGMKFGESEPGDDGLPIYFECTIYRKDRKVSTTVREYMYEVHTNQGAWLTHPRRMLRHKAMVQCARICFGLSGIYDPDEATRMTDKLNANISGHISQPNKSIETTGTTTFLHSEQNNKPRGKESLKRWIKKTL